MIYGENSPEQEQSEQISVSFAYGSIIAAASDTTPGSINFGYDEEHKAGAIFRMGKLVTSRVIDIILSDKETEGVHKVTVKFIDTDGVVREKEFDTVDESLINTLVSNKGSIYVAGNYIEIDESTNEISVSYDSLYEKVKGDLVNDGIGDNAAVDESQFARLKAIEMGYATGVSVDEAVEGIDTVKVTVGLKSRENPNSSFIIENVEFNVPSDSYYERIDSSLNKLIEELENVETNVPSDSYYERIDSSLNKLFEELEKKQDKEEPGTKPTVSMEWLDVEDLLSKVTE